MSIVNIPWNTGLDTINQALEISRWLTEHGLTFNKDYVWYLDTQHKLIKITFSDVDVSCLSLFLLKWTAL